MVNFDGVIGLLAVFVERILSGNMECCSENKVMTCVTCFSTTGWDQNQHESRVGEYGANVSISPSILSKSKKYTY